MRVHDTNLTTIPINQNYVFDIRDFTDSHLLRDITTAATRERFAQERSISSAALNGMLLGKIRTQRGLTGEKFPVPHYLQNLQGFGGKKSKTRKR
jgi:hypothetical protein